MSTDKATPPNSNGGPQLVADRTSCAFLCPTSWRPLTELFNKPRGWHHLAIPESEKSYGKVRLYSAAYSPEPE